MGEQEERDSEFTALEAVDVSVAKIRDLPDKVLLTVWADAPPQSFVLSRQMAIFLGEGLIRTVAELSLPPAEH